MGRVGRSLIDEVGCALVNCETAAENEVEHMPRSMPIRVRGLIPAACRHTVFCGTLPE